MAKFEIPITHRTRDCEVGGRPGYFHMWEYFSKPVPASLTIDGPPAGVIAQVYGIVEFSDGVERVDPCSIKFTDADNHYLRNYEEVLNDISRE